MKKSLEKIQHLIDLTSTGQNKYLHKKLLEIKEDIKNESKQNVKN